MKAAIKNCAIVILAAGKSARMGSPKQLLAYHGKTLLQHTVDTALETGCPSITVVIGAYEEMMRKELNNKQVAIIENKEWQEGMASSIRCGLKKIAHSVPEPESVIFMVCDQPYVSSSILLKLIEKREETGMPIIACRYENTMGTPALFYKDYFPSLMELKGDKGARKLIADNLENAATIQFPEGITDIDTIMDYEFLKNKNDC